MTHKVIRDAVHDMILFHREGDSPTDPVEWGDALLLELLDAPAVQRLRRISQLGHASRIYPCAEHARFSHALGVLHLAKRILTALLRRHPGLLEPRDVLIVKVAALLHDVGHGPYSHVFEHLHPRMGNHESWGWRIITDETGLASVIRRHCQRLGLDAEAFFQGLAVVLGHQPTTPALAIGRQVISSQLDADRMDYLLRDAHFTGVSYGRYDLEWLLHSLRAREVEGVNRLCVDISRGPAALESYVVARDHMYRQVYDHKTVRAFEVLLIHLFSTLVHHWRESSLLPPGVPPELARFLEPLFTGEEPPGVADFLALDDGVLEYAIHHWASLTHAPGLLAAIRWKCRLLRDRKPVYQRLRWQWRERAWEGGEPGHPDLVMDPHAAQALERFFQEHAQTPIPVRDPVEGEEMILPLGLLAWVDHLERAPYGDLPYAADKEDPIYVLDGLDRVLPAERASSRIELLSRTPRRLVRVFADPLGGEAVRALVRAHFSHPSIQLTEG